MDYQTVLTLSIAAFSATIAAATLLLTIRLRARTLEEDSAREQLRYRETQLKYEYAVDLAARNNAVEIAWSTLRTLDETEEAGEVSSATRKRIREVRQLQYALIEALLDSSDAEKGGRDLDRLNGLLYERRSQLTNLPGDIREAGDV